MWRICLATLVHSLVILLVVGHSDQVRVREKVSLVQTARNEGDAVLINLAIQAGLGDLLTKPGNLTLFGPTDDAFFELPENVRQALQYDNQTRVDLLKYHIINQTVYRSHFQNEATFDTLYGQPIRINLYNNNTVVTASGRPIDLGRVDQNATNGVLHILDGVMIPPPGTMATGCRQSSQLKTLTTLLIESGVIKDVDKMIYYHILPGTYYRAGLRTGTLKTIDKEYVNLKVTLDGITVNDANVIAVDQPVSNGVIHLIDKVLTPP